MVQSTNSDSLCNIANETNIVKLCITNVCQLKYYPVNLALYTDMLLQKCPIVLSTAHISAWGEDINIKENKQNMSKTSFIW